MEVPVISGLLGTRVKVPLSLARVTTIGSEVPASELGFSQLGLSAVWLAVQGMYRTGLHPGIAIVIRHRGQVVLDRAIGHTRLGGPTLMTTHTPACLFSGSKAITATLIHALAQDGVLQLDDRVVDYVPEFAANGKQHITIRALLTHRAGIPRIPLDLSDTAVLFDVERVLAALCAAQPDGAGRQAYHAMSAGYVLRAVAERASGQSMRDLLRRTVTDPLGFNTMTYGLPPERRVDAALSYAMGPKHLPPISSVFENAFGMPLAQIANSMNLAGAMDSVLPSSNVFATAHDVASFYQALGDRGGPVLKPGTLAEALKPTGPLRMDGLLPVPVRFSAGFKLGERGVSLFGMNTPKAFGHLGFMNMVSWTDPARSLAVAFINTGKAPSPEAMVGMSVLTTAVSMAFPSA